MENNESVLQGSGVELRKRFYEETSIETDYQPKRGFFGGLCQMIFHPIQYFTPKEKKIGEVKIQIFEKQSGGVDMKVIVKEGKDVIPIHVTHLNKTSDYQKEIDEINNQLKMVVQNHFNVGNQVTFVKPTQPAPLSSSLVYKPKEIVSSQTTIQNEGNEEVNG